eukprot:5798536-Amphidinium_carterae.1
MVSSVAMRAAALLQQSPKDTQLYSLGMGTIKQKANTYNQSKSDNKSSKAKAIEQRTWSRRKRMCMRSCLEVEVVSSTYELPPAGHTNYYVLDSKSKV